MANSFLFFKSRRFLYFDKICVAISLFFFVVNFVLAQSPCLTVGSADFLGVSPETENDFSGPYFIRIYPQAIRLPGGGGSSPNAEAIISALKQMSDFFAPHNIYFVWGDCNIISIEDENLYTNFGSMECDLLYDNLYEHSDGIDIFFGPGSGSSGHGVAAGIGGKTIVMQGAIFGTSSYLSHEMGHCLGLWHTHHGTIVEGAGECSEAPPADPNQCAELINGSNSSTCGDYIPYNQDITVSTPADPGLGQNVDENTCIWNGSNNSPYNPDERNIMSYTVASCMKYFATLQGSRMRNTISNNSILQSCLANYDYSQYVVTQPAIWTTANTPNNGNISIVEELIIEGGATLTIDHGVTVNFKEQGKVIIKPNGRLILKGRLTSLGCFQTWQGVEVWGSNPQPHLSQYPIGGVYAQGRLTSEPGSVIEKAVTAVKSYGPDYAFSGGIINCEGTVFSNNIVGVEFAPYKNYWPFSFPSGWQGQPRNYAGNFSGCTFITDDGYFHEQAFDAFLKMEGVNGVKIAGGSFTNTKFTDGDDIIDWGYGISATDAGFRIVPVCQPGIVPADCHGTTFNGLGYGVHTSKIWDGQPYTIQGAEFTSCFFGHYNSSVVGGSVIQNTFNLGRLPNPSVSKGLQVGVEFESSNSNFLLEENYFVKNSQTDNIITVGTICYKTGFMLKQIRLNHYSGLTIGNLANGFNSGIRYLCNTNHNTDYLYNNLIAPYDFAVTSEGRINPNQGLALATNPVSYGPAANTFSYAFGNTGSDFTNSNDQVRYHYKDLVPFEKPEDVSGNFLPVSTEQSNGCQPTYCTPPCPEPPAPKGEFYARRSAWQTALQDYATNPTPEKADVIALHRGAMDELGGRVLHSILLDTVSYHQDTLRLWLSNIEAYETDLWLAADYYCSGQSVQGQQILNAAPTKFGLSIEEQSDLSRYATILNTLSGQSPYQLSNASLNIIGDYAKSGGHAEALARNILNANESHFSPQYKLPEEIQERDRLGTISSQGVKKDLSIYPNPANDHVSFLLHITTASSVSLRVVDLNGKTVYLASSLPLTGEFVWPTQNVLSGLYFYHLTADGIAPQSGIIIIHH